LILDIPCNALASHREYLNLFHLMVLGLAAFLYFTFDPDAYMKKVEAWFEKRRKK
jgi:hypothetical protein